MHQLHAEEEAEVEEGPTGAPAARVLRFVVGLLGLELHEEPNPWAETWMEALSVGEVSFGAADKKIAREVDEGYWLDRDFKMLGALRSCWPLSGRGRRTGSRRSWRTCGSSFRRLGGSFRAPPRMCFQFLGGP